MIKPGIQIQTTRTDWILEAIAFAGLILTIFILISSYADLPWTIPVHYTGTGQPDGYGSKSMLFVLVATSIVLYVVLTIAARFPDILNYPVRITSENAPRQYANVILMTRIVKVLVVSIFLYLTFVTVQTGIGKMQGLGRWFLPQTVLSLPGTIGVFIYRGYKLR